ncbi:MAG: hypothetical protein H6740_28875 [Alphaproteobacteria bacterium]|nr:hypothetical protein [Alphaproteobacteria bacterium]
MLNTQGEREVLLAGVLTREAGASLRLGELLRVGVGLLRYRFVQWRDVLLDSPAAATSPCGWPCPSWSARSRAWPWPGT